MTGFGLVGYGAIGQVRAEALRQTPGAELRCVVDSQAERCAVAKARFGVRTVATLEELLAQDDIQAVIVSTPPNRHREPCERALLSGKHVLCEKPLASTVADCEAMVETGRKTGKTLATGFNYRFYAAVARAREIIQSGGIGEVIHVKSCAGHPGGPEFTHAWVHDASIMGGGALMDNGIHAADLTLHFLGPVAESRGYRSERVWGFAGSESDGFVQMRTADGRIGTLHASWTEWRGYRFHIDVYGDKGCLRICYPPMLTVHHQRPAGAAKRGRRRIHCFPLFQICERLRSYRWTIIRSFIAEQIDFLARTEDRPGVGASGEDGLHAVELANSAYA